MKCLGFTIGVRVKSYISLFKIKKGSVITRMAKGASSGCLLRATVAIWSTAGRTARGRRFTCRQSEAARFGRDSFKSFPIYGWNVGGHLAIKLCIITSITTIYGQILSFYKKKNKLMLTAHEFFFSFFLLIKGNQNCWVSWSYSNLLVTNWNRICHILQINLIFNTYLIIIQYFTKDVPVDLKFWSTPFEGIISLPAYT